MLVDGTEDSVKLVDLEALNQCKVSRKKNKLPPPCVWAGTDVFASPEYLEAQEYGQAWRATPAHDMWCLGKACLQRLLFLDAEYPYPAARADLRGYSSWEQEAYDTMPLATALLEQLMAPRPADRPTSEQVLQHLWLQQEGQGSVKEIAASEDEEEESASSEEEESDDDDDWSTF